MSEYRALEENAQMKKAATQGHPVETRYNRYGKSITKLAELAAKAPGERLVLHLVGVGERGGPQLSEAIGAFLKTGKKLEVHVIDWKQQLVDDAVTRARMAFPDAVVHTLENPASDAPLVIVPHWVDIAAPEQLPARRADAVIATNVLQHIPQPHYEAGLYHLSSMTKDGGHILVEEIDLDTTDMRLEEFGLKEHGKPITEIRGPRRERGVILKRAGYLKPFSEIWEKAKRLSPGARR